MKTNKIIIGLLLVVIAILVFLIIKKQDSENVKVFEFNDASGIQKTNTQGTGVVGNTENKNLSLKNLTTKYIRVQQEPEIKILSEVPICNIGKGVGDVAFVTTERMIDGKKYCIQTQTEGAAGSSYTTYIYTTGVVQTSFVLKMVGCGGYDDPEKTECEIERANFSADQIFIN